MGFRKTDDLVVLETGQTKIRDVITEMIAYARQAGPGVLVRTEHNNKTIVVAADSDPLLIVRDYFRSFCGHLGRNTIGPWPEQKLSGLEGYSAEDMATPAFWNMHRPR